VAVSVEKRIYDFLQQQKLKDGDGCIATKIPRPVGGHVNSTQVRNATSAFEVTKEFKRSSGACSACHQDKKVIRAL
jgi:hypothetical protein